MLFVTLARGGRQARGPAAGALVAWPVYGERKKEEKEKVGLDRPGSSGAAEPPEQLYGESHEESEQRPDRRVRQRAGDLPQARRQPTAPGGPAGALDGDANDPGQPR